MKNPFKPDEFSPQVLKRQPRDLSHRKVFTTEFGKGMPVLCQEVFPGDTVKLENIDLKIQGMPTFFPLTSRLKVSVSYFYCRNRCVDEDWEDFIFNTKPIDKAWLRMDSARAKIMISTGSLGDMFGIPSTIGDATTVSRPWVYMNRLLTLRYPFTYSASSAAFLAQCKDILLKNVVNINSLFLVDLPTNLASYVGVGDYLGSMLLSDRITSVPNTSDVSFRTNVSLTSVSYSNLSCVAVCYDGLFRQIFDCGLSFSSSGTVSFSGLSSLFQTLRSYDLSQHDVRLMFCLFEQNVSSSSETPLNNLVFVNSGGDRFTFKYLGDSKNIVETPSVPQQFDTNEVLDSTGSDVIAQNIYVGSNPVNKLEAHAFRHYTMIGNYYYRNERNNPYVLNGNVEYNKFIPTMASGPDDNVYDYFYRNWELDRFTSCCQTPQQGDAPLVGLSVNGSVTAADLTFAATDSEGVQHDYKIRVGIGEDYRIDSIANFDDDTPSAVLQRVTDMISYGTSINNFRVTNSFQRFKERAQHGLRYRVQMKSHLGVNVDYPDIDIPQYIGGFNGDINSFRNENMAASEYANLGDFNGSLFGNFSSQHPITLQVPEHGYIMGIMTIVPVPMYPQSVTNKALIKRSPFEYPLQEFMKVGNEPVLYSEVMPFQNAVGQSPSDVFGYRRPFAEYLNNLDEVHGDFRTSLRNFNCVRMFAERPELSAMFTTVHPEELNQVFITQNIADKYGSNSKFLCLIDYKMSALRQIPDGDPALE